MKHSSPQNLRQTVRLEEKDVGRDMYGFAACMSRWKTANIEKRRTFGGMGQHSRCRCGARGGQMTSYVPWVEMMQWKNVHDRAPLVGVGLGEVMNTRKKKCKLKDRISTVDDCIMDSSQTTTGSWSPLHLHHLMTKQRVVMISLTQHRGRWQGRRLQVHAPLL